MKKYVFFIVATIMSILVSTALTTGKTRSNHPNISKRKLIDRGRYLVNNVAMCVDCHTPKDNYGRPIKSKWLRGATLDFKPIHHVPMWVDKSNRIAGLPKGWTKKDMIKFLTTGIDPQGRFARPPMPPYRFSRKDAIAVTEYLKSLK